LYLGNASREFAIYQNMTSLFGLPKASETFLGLYKEKLYRKSGSSLSERIQKMVETVLCTQINYEKSR